MIDHNERLLNSTTAKRYLVTFVITAIVQFVLINLGGSHWNVGYLPVLYVVLSATMLASAHVGVRFAQEAKKKATQKECWIFAAGASWPSLFVICMYFLFDRSFPVSAPGENAGLIGAIVNSIGTTLLFLLAPLICLKMVTSYFFDVSKRNAQK